MHNLNLTFVYGYGTFVYSVRVFIRGLAKRPAHYSRRQLPMVIKNNKLRSLSGYLGITLSFMCVVPSYRPRHRLSHFWVLPGYQNLLKLRTF